jgi:hypothetical protein
MTPFSSSFLRYFWTELYERNRKVLRISSYEGDMPWSAMKRRM